MKVVAIIPARYQSSRFPGKPLADICGRPMIWWVYNQVKKAQKIDDVIVATDDLRIARECEKYGLNFQMTSSSHGTSTERLNEVASRINSDLYIAVNGDEPLIDPVLIDSVVPDDMPKIELYVGNLMTKISDPVQALDSSNIKIVTDDKGYAMLYSRNMIPYPKKSIDYDFYKHVGIIIYNRKALDFFASTSKGYLERIEDINELRFLEHGVKIKMTIIDAHSLSVDTPMDLEYVRNVVEEKIKQGIIKL